MNIQGARILIVEDELFVAMAARGMIESHGGIVTGIARSVTEAFLKIKECGLDCVMLDINLRGDL